MPDHSSNNDSWPIAMQIKHAEHAIACHDANVRTLFQHSCDTAVLMLKRHRTKLLVLGAVTVVAGLWLYPRRHALMRKWNGLQQTAPRGSRTMAPPAFGIVSKWLRWLRSPVVRLVTSVVLPLLLKSRQSGSVSTSTTSASTAAESR